MYLHLGYRACREGSATCSAERGRRVRLAHGAAINAGWPRPRLLGWSVVGMYYGEHVVAAERRDLDGFDTSGPVRRGRMRPVGELHAIRPSYDRTLCGMKRQRLYMFPDLNFTTSTRSNMCLYCRSCARV